MRINNATPAINSNIQNTSQKPAFKGLERFKPTKLFTLDRQGPMSRDLFILNAFVFLLGSRLFTARDKKGPVNDKNEPMPKDFNGKIKWAYKRVINYFCEKDEKRETLVRDVPTIIIAVMGVPVISNFAAKFVQKKTGFAICENVKKGTVKFNQLEDWYKYDENLASGFEGFSKRLSDLGGNLKKIYSSIGCDVKGQLKGLSNNNTEFMQQLAQKDELLKTIQNEVSKTGNKVLKQASFLKTVPTLIGFAITLVTIGLFIPKFNIFITESIHKNKKKEAENPTNTNMGVEELDQAA